MVFCWTRYGAEAGEPFEQILRRKEVERVANGGVFLWGIGNALGPSIRVLLGRTHTPRVAFSPMKSRPRAVDVNPSAVVAWTKAETLDGEPFELPANSLVTSRFDATRARRAHYALVCFSVRCLRLDEDPATLAFGDLRNLVSGRRLGASQVTAVVERLGPSVDAGATYPVPFLADLRPPYFVKLTEPVPIESASQVRKASTEARMKIGV